MRKLLLITLLLLACTNVDEVSDMSATVDIKDDFSVLDLTQTEDQSLKDLTDLTTKGLVDIQTFLTWYKNLIGKDFCVFDFSVMARKYCMYEGFSGVVSYLSFYTFPYMCSWKGEELIMNIPTHFYCL